MPERPAAVPGGYNNEACDSDDAIGGGADNGIAMGPARRS